MNEQGWDDAKMWTTILKSILFLLFRLQKETTACVRVHVVSQRQQVCSRDEIVILLYDRLWWKRLKKEGGKGRKKSYWRDKRMKKKERWHQMVLFQLQREMYWMRAPDFQGTNPDLCKYEALIHIWLKSLIQLKGRRK